MHKLKDSCPLEMRTEDDFLNSARNLRRVAISIVRGELHDRFKCVHIQTDDLYAVESRVFQLHGAVKAGIRATRHSGERKACILQLWDACLDIVEVGERSKTLPNLRDVQWLKRRLDKYLREVNKMPW